MCGIRILYKKGLFLALVVVLLHPMQGYADSLSESDIIEIQLTLRLLGFDAGPADGKPGKKTAEAIRKYEEYHGFPVTRKPSDTLLNRLRGRLIEPVGCCVYMFTNTSTQKYFSINKGRRSDGYTPERWHANGPGVDEYGNNKYDGNYLNNLFDGKGTYYFSNGDKYVGEWKSGKKHGKGTYYFSSGNKYVGDWKNDARNGKGTFYNSSGGKKYAGDWKNSTWHGQGTAYYKSGTKYVGEWNNNARHGNGIAYYADGRIKEYLFSDNEVIKQKVIKQP